MRLDHLLSKGFCIFGPRARWAWHAVGFWGGAPWCPGPRPPFFVGGGLGVVGGLVVNCIVDASIDIVVVLRFVVVVVRLCVLCVVGSLVLSVRWMPWHRGPMKDAVACDMPRGAGLRAVIRGFPNGGTRRPLWGVTRV